ncbi:hypothetical protein [Streptomyces sp. N50]|uniref:dTMP kinase n=1 Tax=Streptomyces sp. N50 TaxID=3081765 RepID=UPI00296212E7|nr:hypothetical protein [Streptomyces sp. N50]WOX12305.1 hypothetical protein R2B38_27255 [Streptomyces sp. N50]
MGVKGSLIAFEGIDGSGKTTTAKALSDAIREQGGSCVFMPKRAVVSDEPYVREHLETLAEIIWSKAKHAPTHLLGYDYWIHAVASYFFAVEHACIRPLLAAGTTVVVDNWFYKFALRISLASGKELATVLSCFEDLLEPDTVFYLDVSAEKSASRKGEFSWAETGSTEKDRPSQEQELANFVTYQNLVREGYRPFLEKENWNPVDPGDATAEQTAKMLVAKRAR